MRKLSGLRRSTPANIRTNARRVKVRLVGIDKGTRKGKSYQEIHYEALDTSLPRRDAQVHKCVIRYFGDKLSTSADVWVSCNCQYYRYVLEVANTAKGSSSIEYSTGARPRKRNPRLRSGLCKHLFRASELAVKLRPKK